MLLLSPGDMKGLLVPLPIAVEVLPPLGMAEPLLLIVRVTTPLVAIALVPATEATGEPLPQRQAVRLLPQGLWMPPMVPIARPMHPRWSPAEDPLLVQRGLPSRIFPLIADPAEQAQGQRDMMDTKILSLLGMLLNIYYTSPSSRDTYSEDS